MFHPLNSMRGRILFIVFLSFLPVFMLIWWSTEERKTYSLDFAQLDALALAETVANHNEQHIETSHQLLIALSNVSAIYEQNEEQCNRFLAELNAAYLMYNSMWVVDADTGFGFCSAIPFEQPVDNRVFDWYQQVLETRNLVISNYRIGVVSRRPNLTAAYPIFDENREITAVVALGISLQWLEQILIDEQVPNGSTVTLLDEDGIILARYPRGEGIVGTPYYNTFLIEQFTTEKRGMWQGEGKDGDQRLFAYTTVGTEFGSLGVIVSLSETMVLANEIMIRDRNLALLTIIGTMVAIFSWVGSDFLTRPIHQLIDASVELSKGSTNSQLPHKTPLSELNKLIQAFNALSNSVEEQNRERMEVLAHEIEERKRAQAQTSLLQQFAAALSEAVTPHQVAQVLLTEGLLAKGASLAAIALKENHSDGLKMLTSFAQSEFQLLPVGKGMPLTDVFLSGEGIFLADASEISAMYPNFEEWFPDYVIESLASVPLIIDKQVIGSILLAFEAHRDLDGNFRRLVTTIANYCAQALARAFLYEQIHELATTEERQRLARDLHDSVTQMLFSSSILAQTLSRTTHALPEKTTQLIQQLNQLNISALAELRALLAELRPERLVQTSLAQLLKQLADAAMGHKNFKVEVNADESITLPPDVQVNFYRIAQETLNNIVKHAEASHVGIVLKCDADEIILTIEDNGQGFVPDSNRSNGMGISSMHERAQMCNAKLELQSQIGQGTMIKLRWEPV